MPVERESTAAVLQVGQTEDEVPLLLRVEVLICDGQNAECVSHCVIAESIVNIGSIQLEVGAVLPRRDIVSLEEVGRHSLFGDRLSVPLLLLKLGVRFCDFDADTVVESLAVLFELCDSRVTDGIVNDKQIDRAGAPWVMPLDERAATLVCLDILPTLFLCL